jgi:hypothetical protein
MNKMSEQNILKEALSRFNQITGGRAKQLVNTSKEVDSIIQIIVDKNKKDFLVEIRSELRRTDLADILRKIYKEKGNWLLVSKYIPKPLKDELRAQGINYLETAGNCYISAESMFFYINDRPVTPARQTETGKLWKVAGLKFIFAIISDPTLLDKSYRAMAEAALIALGNIGTLLEELERAGYLERKDDKWILVNKDFLMLRWTAIFPVTLRPRLSEGHFRFLDDSTKQNWKSIVPNNFFWGGEPAGELFTDFLHPETFTIYSNENPTGLMRQLKLVPDKKGEVELLKQFWNSEAIISDITKMLHVVPSLLAYADLMDNKDSRNWETAEKIKVNFLHE